MSLVSCPLLHGTVDFSTRTQPHLACNAMSRRAPSDAVIAVARQAPTPRVSVGVFTEVKYMSASLIVSMQAVKKKRFGWRAGAGTSPDLRTAAAPSLAFWTTSSKPGSWVGRCRLFHISMHLESRSTTVTWTLELCRAITAAVGRPDDCQSL